MASSKTPRSCWCDCGNTTRGGKFLPGHDSKFVAWQVSLVRADLITASEALHVAPSPALHNKIAAGLRKIGWTYDTEYARWVAPSGNPEVLPAYLNQPE